MARSARLLPTDVDHAAVFVTAYHADLDTLWTASGTSAIAGTTSDGLFPLAGQLCHLAARCEIQVGTHLGWQVVFVLTYISWRNEYAGGFIRWTGQGAPPVVTAFTAQIAPITSVGHGWWWSEPR